MSRTACKLCAEPLEPRLGTGGTGRSGAVSVELGPYLARTCPVGHFRHFPAPGFGGAVRDGLASLLPVGAVCPGCGTGAAGPAESVRVAGAVPAPQGEGDARDVGVAVEAPGHRCGCGVAWVSPELDEDLSDALVAAFLGLRP